MKQTSNNIQNVKKKGEFSNFSIFLKSENSPPEKVLMRNVKKAKSMFFYLYSLIPRKSSLVPIDLRSYVRIVDHLISLGVVPPVPPVLGSVVGLRGPRGPRRAAAEVARWGQRGAGMALACRATPLCRPDKNRHWRRRASRRVAPAGHPNDEDGGL